MAQKFEDVLFGSENKVQPTSLVSKQQQQLLDLINEGLISGKGSFADLFGSFNQDEFNTGVRQPALKEYRESILPQLLEKFVGSGQTRGSALQRGVLKSGTDLASKLAELQYAAQQQQKQNRQTGLNTALGKQAHENVIFGQSEGLVPGVAKAFAHGAGQAIAG